MIATTVALVRDTFREAFARKIFWGLFGLSTLMILFFLFLLKIDIVEGAMASLSLFGHTNKVEVGRLVRRVYGSIATFTFAWSTALAVLASSGLIPSVLEPGRVELILSKPLSRVHLLLGRFLGNVLVVALNASYLVFGVWIIFGVKTGIWGNQFLWTIVTTVFIFSVLLTVVVLIGVLFESAALATMATLGLMLVSPILAQTKVMVKLLNSELARDLFRGLYYILPKVFDLGRITLELVGSEKPESYQAVYTSALFGFVVLSAAVYFFTRRDF